MEVRIYVDDELVATKRHPVLSDALVDEFGLDMLRAFTSNGWAPVSAEDDIVSP